MELEELKQAGQAPAWMTTEGYQTLKGGYLIGNETPCDMYKRLAKTAAKYLKKPALEDKFFNILWKSWLCPATPVAANFGAERGLPISCYSLHTPDSVDGIYKSVHELAMLSKHGGGVGICMSNVRARNSIISGNNGRTEGIVPWLKSFDTTTIAVSQSSTRRGASAFYLDIEHGDIEEYLQIRKPQGDINRQCLNVHQAVTITDSFMEKVKSGDARARHLWRETLKTRFETGEPYLMFIDTANRLAPQCYKDLGLKIETSNICNEIYLHTDAEHTFVCCLSSLNLAKYDEWAGTDLPELAIWFLDAVMEEFLLKADGLPGLERAVRFAKKSRALGLGVLGWHTYLQQHSIPFDSFEAFKINNKVFKEIREATDRASTALAAEYGEPEWCKGYGRRNTHTIAVAPTVSNSTISGNVSPSIEPLPALAFTKKSAKGTWVQKNQILERLLTERGKNTRQVWQSIVENSGSVQHLSVLTDAEKDVFRTAREINQFSIIKQAAQRGKYIDQGQSLNLYVTKDISKKLLHKLHMAAWEEGLKGLYYLRTENVNRGDMGSRGFSAEECKACEG